MVNIIGKEEWTPVRILEQNELARGGLNGNMNEQAKALSNRTEFLNKQKANKSDVIQGNFLFKTLAEFEEIKNDIPANSNVIIDEVGIHYGNNIWDGDVLTKSDYDPLNQAKDFTKDRIDLKPTPAYEFSIQDKFGNLALGITPLGVVEVSRLGTGDTITEQKSLGGYAQVWADKSGNIAIGIRKDGSVHIPKLITKDGSSQPEINFKRLSIVESDTIMHIGDSMTASHYCVQDKSHVSQLSQLSPFRHINYGLSDDTLLRMQNRIINDVQMFGASLKSMKPKYLFIHSYVNDRPFATVNTEYFQENARRLIDVCLAHGVQPVIVGYFVLNSMLHQAIKSVSDEYQIPVIWNDVLNKQIGFYDGATLFHEWHVGTRTNGLFWIPALEYIKQQKPMRTLKIFRKRPNFTHSLDYQLLFTGAVDKSKKWKEIGIGHYSLSNEQKYDEIHALGSADYTWTYRDDEYALLSKKQPITFSDYGLIEIGLDAYPQHIQSIKINLSVTGAVSCFIRDNINTATAMPAGLPTDQFYKDNYKNPRGFWREVDLIDGVITISKDQIINSMVGKNIWLMLKGNFSLLDISIEYSATKYESHLPTLNKTREHLGPELLAQPLLGNSSQLSGWVTSGIVETLVPIDLAKSPRKPDLNIPIDGVVTLTTLNHVEQAISFPISEEVRTFKVVAWARYFPRAYLDRSNPSFSDYDSAQVVDRSAVGAVAPINKDTFDIEEIRLETWVGEHPVQNGAFHKDYVAMIWRPVTFYVEVQPYETDLSIRLNAVSGQVQLAKCSIKEVI